MKVLSLSELYERLCGFDWWYDYSDDHRVWTNGVNGEKELERLAESLGESGKEMFFKFRYDYKMGKIERPQLSDFIEEK